MSKRPLAYLLPLILLPSCTSHPTYQFSARHTTIETDPPGARVYQLSPVTGDRIFLGTTPLHDQPVMVLAGASNLPHPERAIPALYTQHGTLRVHIEKPGYLPLDTNLPTGEKETLPQKLTLEPLPK